MRNLIMHIERRQREKVGKLKAECNVVRVRYPC